MTTLELTNALKGTPTYFRMNAEARADQEAQRAALAAELAKHEPKAQREDEAAQAAFDKAYAKREEIRSEFNKQAFVTNELLNAATETRLRNKAVSDRLRQQLYDLADPAILPAIQRVDDAIEAANRGEIFDRDRRGALEAQTAEMRVARADLERLLLTANVDAAATVAAILKRSCFA